MTDAKPTKADLSQFTAGDDAFNEPRLAGVA